MGLIDKLKRFAGNYFLSKTLAGLQREKRMTGIYSASSVAILFELTDESVYQEVHRYLQGLQEKKIRVKALGFASDKVAATHFLPVLTFDLFSNKNLNWFRIPKTAMIRDFADSEFDILINLASEQVFPLKYIAASSKARLKAGSYSESDPEDPACSLRAIYDILLKTDDPHDQGELLRNFNEYIIMLNPRDHG